jgi:hypothetical protein
MSNENKVINRGTGAGGAKTNENGIKLEEKVREGLSKYISIINTTPSKNIYKVQTVKINSRDDDYIRAPEGAFSKWGEKKSDKNISKLHGAKNPDDCLINITKNIINWIEAKELTSQGSVCEKIQTYSNKIRNLKKRYPGWEINYIYVLARKFESDCPAEIQDLKDDCIDFIYADNSNLSEELLKVII